MVTFGTSNVQIGSFDNFDIPTFPQTHEAPSMARRPTSSCLMLFEGVDGGEERACRGSTADDNSEEYFQVKEAQTLETWMILDVRWPEWS